MGKKELLKKTNWTRKDISDYFDITLRQVSNAIKNANLKPLAINIRKFSIPEVLEAFGTSLQRELTK